MDFVGIEAATRVLRTGVDTAGTGGAMAFALGMKALPALLHTSLVLSSAAASRVLRRYWVMRLSGSNLLSMHPAARALRGMMLSSLLVSSARLLVVIIGANLACNMSHFTGSFVSAAMGAARTRAPCVACGFPMRSAMDVSFFSALGAGRTRVATVALAEERIPLPVTMPLGFEECGYVAFRPEPSGRINDSRLAMRLDMP
mmetsp:Transcript_91880/g.159397  ORF Transcript_91880/g.159397 Transcript_91880/m.159397 type:complete len:201 (-) Transcript_91880:1911-2513(-)